MMQPDIGQTLLIFLSWLTLVFLSGISLTIFLTVFTISIFILFYLVFFVSRFEYIKNRIFYFFDPNTGTHNFQSEKAIDAISSGGFFGKGIGEGTLKNRVPEAHTDYIVSVISEEFGIVIVILLLFIFLFFIYTVFKRIYLEKDEKVKLILTGLITLIISQALIHLGVILDCFPLLE